jgi:hypothetical protein
LLTKDYELLVEQACRQRGDARGNMGRALVFGAQHSDIEVTDPHGEAGWHTRRLDTWTVVLT